MGNDESQQDKRLAENEVFFREHNETVEREFSEHKNLANDDNISPLLPDEGQYNFYCECADEKCAKRVALTLKKYAEIHKIRDHFVIAPGHEVENIEDVIFKGDAYMIVRKHVRPPKKADGLNPTKLDNKEM